MNENIESATTIDLTEACNLRCWYCFTYSEHKPKKLSFDMAKKIIDYWMPKTKNEENHNISISAWGGEPLLEWNLWKDIVKYANRKADELGRSIEYGGTTNGVLMTPDKVEWMAENNSSFLVSIDGTERAHKDRVFPDGSNSWPIVHKNVIEAKKVYPAQRIRMTITNENAKYFFESIQYVVEDLGMDNFAFSPAYECDWTEKNWAELEEQLEKIVDWIVLKAKNGTPVILKHLNDTALNEGQQLGPYNPCGAGNAYTGWSVDGFQYPCHRFNKHGQSSFERANSPLIIAGPLGNNGEIIPVNWEWRKQFIHWKDNVPQHCSNCEYYGYSICNGGCYAVNYDLGEHSIFGHVEKQCKYLELLQKAGIRYAKLMREQNILIPETGWGGNIKKRGSCICYNMCYSEGTDQEIIHINRQTEEGCVCYNTAYNGRVDAQARTIRDIDKEKELKAKFLDLSKRILQTRDEEKSEEQMKLEIEILEKTIGLL
jgi:uncharacterized protein